MFRAISALISAASPDKMDRNTKLRAPSGTTNMVHLVTSLSLLNLWTDKKIKRLIVSLVCF